MAWAIIGVVELVDCLQDFHSEWAVMGHWHWCLRNPQPFYQAGPCPGKPGVWRPLLLSLGEGATAPRPCGRGRKDDMCRGLA